MGTQQSKVMLNVENLNKTFGSSVQAVKDLSFKINKGEIFGFLGPNGAGKTTTMRMITGFLPQTSGKITIDGVNYEDDPMSVKRKIGYLPESTPLYSDMKVEEYLHFVGKIRGITGENLKKSVEKMIETCGLKQMRQRALGHLSKGYRQRVGLAQALIHNPDLLILDEPMSGLDPNQIVEIRNLIKEIGKEKTVIYCSHILSEVSATCDRILIINNGSSVATGTAEELTKQTDKYTTYLITVKTNENSKDIIEKLDTVKSVEVINNSGKTSKLKISVEDSDSDFGEVIFDTAVENGWKLSEIRKESQSLEDVFTKLTRS